jgi:threonine/homoserine/homoserine lactone efflux protein
MLDDYEKNALDEVERRLLSEDPEFAQVFDVRAESLSRASAVGAGIKIFLIGGLLVSALVLLAGSLSGAVAFAIATWLIWLAWRFSARMSSRQPRSGNHNR